MVEGSNTGKMKLKVVVRQGDQRMVQQLAQFSLRCPKLATAVFEKIATFFKYPKKSVNILATFVKIANLVILPSMAKSFGSKKSILSEYN